MRKLLLTLHVTASVGWLGAALAYLAIAARALTRVEVALYSVLELVGWYVIAPLAVAALLTGVVQSLVTPWGLLRHYWVVAKLALTAFGTTILLLHLPSVSAAVRAPSAEAAKHLVFHAAAGSALLLVVVVLSVFKPWGKTRFARKT